MILRQSCAALGEQAAHHRLASAKQLRGGSRRNVRLQPAGIHLEVQQLAEFDGSAARRLGALPEAVACHATNNAIAALLPRSAVRTADIADARFIAPVLATALFYGSLLRADARAFSAG